MNFSSSEIILYLEAILCNHYYSNRRVAIVAASNNGLKSCSLSVRRASLKKREDISERLSTTTIKLKSRVGSNPRSIATTK